MEQGKVWSGSPSDGLHKRPHKLQKTRSLRLNTHDLHIIRRLTVGYVAIIGVLCVFFVLLHYVEFIDDFMSKGATTKQVFSEYYPNYLPEIIKLISPLALFLAAVFLTAKLAQELYIVAMLSSSVSLYRLFVPYVAFAIFVTGGMIAFNGFVVPLTQKKVVAFEQTYFKQASRQLDTSNLHRQNRPGSVVTVRYFDQKSNVAHRVSLQDFDDQQMLKRRTDALDMRWIDSLKIWRLNRPVTRVFKPGGIEERFEEETRDTTLNLYPRDLSRTERDVEMLTLPEAEEYIEALHRSGVSNIGQQLVSYHLKYAYPVANLVLVLIAFPFAAVRRRRGQAVQLARALLLAFLYFASTKVAEPFGYAGTVPAWVAVWLPHVVFALVGLYLLMRVRK